MASSLFLAQVIGWYLVIVGVFMLFKQNYLKSVMNEIIARKELILILAIITLILGLLLVVAHNQWTCGWPIIITLIAWLTLIGGIFRLFFPNLVLKMGERMLNSSLYLRISSFFIIIVGLFLLYQVYGGGLGILN